jgi:peptidoglycan hydrolase-like protein with peptidoglycan-binding domain
MTVVGADYSSGRPGGAALAAAGVQVVGRYVSAGRNDINISAAEVRDLQSHGINVFTYNEHEASYMLGGASRAATVAPSALKVSRAAGLPDGPIIYAVDFDATRGGVPTSAGALGDMRKLSDFLTGAAKATSWDLVGVYGGYYVIDWLMDNLPNLKHAVQTSAWSAGHWDSRAFCRQDAYNWIINGVNCDHLTVTKTDTGALRFGNDVKPPVKPPVKFVLSRYLKYVPTNRMHGADVVATQKKVRVTADGDFGAKTQAGVAAWQRAHRLTADGIVGPATCKSFGWTWRG